MTKEPIIIDDVDVSECEFFSSGLGYCTIGLLANDGTHICECEQNCYYKQLKRKEQECEELNNIITSLENTKEELLTKIDLQKKENIIFTLETRKLVVHYSSKLERLKQALQEIRQVVEFAMEEVLTIGQRNATAKILEILQKCEEQPND